jgi:hypothetical protein
VTGLRPPRSILREDLLWHLYGHGGGGGLLSPRFRFTRLRGLPTGGTIVVDPDTFQLGVTRPDAGNTGADPAVTQTVVTGVTTISSAGATVTAMDFRNYVYVRAANVTFRNCTFRGAPSGSFVTYGLVDCRDPSAQNTLIDRCTFAATATNMYWCNGVSVRNGATVTVNRCDISAVADGLNVSNSALTATGNYVHGLYFFNNSADHSTDAQHPYWEHNDGVQIQGGAGPVLIRGNNFSTYAQLGTDDGVHGLPAVDPATGSWNRRYGCGVTASPDAGQITGVTITENWFEAGTANFQSSSAAEVGAAFGTIGGNRFGMDQYNYGGGSRYQIRYKAGINIAGLTSNYFDPDAASVPDALKGQLFTVGFATGIRLD